MREIKRQDLKGLYRPAKNSHKGQNGKLAIIGGSALFHGASLWALKIASRIVDMVYYSSIPENNQLAAKLKTEIFDFICVPRKEIEAYIAESDAILIGPGLTRNIARKSKLQLKIKNYQVKDWEDTYEITRYFLHKFPHKKWIIDAGSLQMMEAEWLKQLSQVIITPHQQEFCELFKVKRQKLKVLAKKYGCIIVLKGAVDYVCGPEECVINTTGNEGMTKGGSGDVLAGLIAALACKNDLFLASQAGVYFNGLAGDRLYKKVGPYFNASDLCDQVPVAMKEVLGYN